MFRALGSAATPFWFWEGDAVDIESRLTNYGRGREPNFTRISRTNINSFGLFNYYKQTLGSYKYKTPNEYESGYIMTRYLKRNYGDFDTGQTPTSYLGYEVFEKTKQFIVYQRILDDLGFIEEQMYLSNKKYDELLGIFYNQLEEEMAESESQN